MGKILIVDDDATFLDILGNYIKTYYPLLDVETCTSPVKALNAIRKQKIDLLLVDLEMPMLDGAKIFKYATDAGIDKNRIVILSGRDADYLHEHFPMGHALPCLTSMKPSKKTCLT